MVLTFPFTCPPTTHSLDREMQAIQVISCILETPFPSWCETQHGFRVEATTFCSVVERRVVPPSVALKVRPSLVTDQPYLNEKRRKTSMTCLLDPTFWRLDIWDSSASSTTSTTITAPTAPSVTTRPIATTTANTLVSQRRREKRASSGII